MKKDSATRLCAIRELENSGLGVRFVVQLDGRSRSAFVIRFDGEIKAFINECAHIGVELDWQPGIFFDSTGQQLICSTHGARYNPLTGECISGRCAGRGLIAIKIREVGEEVHLVDGKGVHLEKIIEGQSDV
ncbi:MAG TPA: Rieske (2Fe-2S) protein [Acidiferrobacteraceae bacterium]|nr:Rieske (2Fe-2S) protein [Acidiferrobacteraceae bacterium]